MSLPTASSKPSVQPSIRSFFQKQPPKYAPPPSQSNTSDAATIPLAPAPPPAPPREEASGETIEEQGSPPVIPPIPANAIPREASIRPVDANDIAALRRINALLLSVSYPDVFYQRAVDPARNAPFSRVITWAHDGEDPKIVGAVVCTVEPAVAQQPRSLYIQSLCLLSPYRGMGLVNAALDNIVATAMADPKLAVKVVTAHVWTENEEGLAWYQSRGFTRVGQAIRGYYLKLRPDSAWLVQRAVAASVQSSLPSASLPPTARPVALSTTAAIANLPPPPAQNGDLARPPPRTTTGQSFQGRRADMEWNDLPDDMAPTPLGAPKASKTLASGPPSGASSRSNSMARKKRDRSYPAAAFGS